MTNLGIQYTQRALSGSARAMTVRHAGESSSSPFFERVFRTADANPGAASGSSDSAASPWSRSPKPAKQALANRKLACDRLLPVLGPQHNVVKHHRAVPHREVAAAIEIVRESTAPSALRCVRVPCAECGAGRPGSWGSVERDQSGEGCLDDSREPDEDRPQAPGAAVWAGARGPRSCAEAGRRRESDRVRYHAWATAGRRADVPTAQAEGRRLCPRALDRVPAPTGAGKASAPTSVSTDGRTTVCPPL